MREILQAGDLLATSFADGPNGPLVPELKALFPDAPGNTNAWDNEDFVKAVKATGQTYEN